MVGNSCQMGRGDDVTCRLVGYVISESKRHISVITKETPDLETLFFWPQEGIHQSGL